MALMTGLRDGKLDDKLIYFDLDDDAKHDRFWTTELDSVRQYNIELITQTGVYNYYNLYVMQELAYGNELIDLSLLEIWSAEGRPPLICFPIHNSPSNGIRSATNGSMRLMVKTVSAHTAPARTIR